MLKQIFKYNNWDGLGLSYTSLHLKCTVSQVTFWEPCIRNELGFHNELNLWHKVTCKTLLLFYCKIHNPPGIITRSKSVPLLSWRRNTIWAVWHTISSNLELKLELCYCNLCLLWYQMMSIRYDQLFMYIKWCERRFYILLNVCSSRDRLIIARNVSTIHQFSVQTTVSL